MSLELTSEHGLAKQQTAQLVVGYGYGSSQKIAMHSMHARDCREHAARKRSMTAVAAA